MLCYNKYRSEEHKLKMRVCWNRQTGTFEGRVFHDVWVQVPSLAPVMITLEVGLVSGFQSYFLRVRHDLI